MTIYTNIHTVYIHVYIAKVHNEKLFTMNSTLFIFTQLVFNTPTVLSTLDDLHEIFCSNNNQNIMDRNREASLSRELLNMPDSSPGSQLFSEQKEKHKPGSKQREIHLILNFELYND